MTDPLTLVSTRRTPQTEPTRPEQVRNAAGGYAFAVTDDAALRRFLTLGTTGGTYYVGQDQLTADAVAPVLEAARQRPRELVDLVVEISAAGRAPKQQPALFALAAAASLGDDDGRRYALDALHLVARTGTHLFTFLGYAQQHRGWGRALRRAAAAWYTHKPAEQLAYQLVKYRQRDGWTHRDVLRKAHPTTADPTIRALLGWATGKGYGPFEPSSASRLVLGYEAVQTAPADEVPALLHVTKGLPWEALPDAALTRPDVWEALLDTGAVPATALIRQLPRLTRLGLLPQIGGRTAQVCELLLDPERLRRGRIHPINVLVALRTYAAGASARGDSTWEPTQRVVDALDGAFYAAFGAVEPAGKRTWLGVDISGSMGAAVTGLPLTCREAAAALALVTVATEPETAVFGFTAGPNNGYGYGWGLGGGHRNPLHEQGQQTTWLPLPISPRQRLDDVLRVMDGLPFGRTDCALPMVAASRARAEVDTFIVATDNETYAGAVHPHQALEAYRRQSGINAKLAVVAMTPTRYTIADPADPTGQLDVAGFDAALPNLLSSFSRGF